MICFIDVLQKILSVTTTALQDSGIISIQTTAPHNGVHDLNVFHLDFIWEKKSHREIQSLDEEAVNRATTNLPSMGKRQKKPPTV